MPGDRDFVSLSASAVRRFNKTTRGLFAELYLKGALTTKAPAAEGNCKFPNPPKPLGYTPRL